MSQNKYKTDEELKKTSIKEEDIPWITSTKLISWVNTTWWTWWNKTLTFTRLASVWTWLQTFWWFWFSPTDYIIKAWRYWDVTETWFTLLCMSEWQYSAPFRQRIRPNGVYYIELDQTTSILSISYWNIPLWKSTVASHSAFTWDWIVLNFTSSLEDIMIQITAIK